MGTAEVFQEQLKQTCRLTGARWAAWVALVRSEWQIEEQVGLTARRREALSACLEQPTWRSWLGGAVANGRVRSRRVPSEARKALGERVYAFPNQQRRGVLLVDGEALDATARRFFKILSLSGPSVDAAVESTQSAGCRLIGKLSGAWYRPEEAATEILQTIAEEIPAQRMYLALREGRTLRMLAALGDQAERLQAAEVGLEQVPDWRPLWRGDALLTLEKEPWPDIPTPQPWTWVGVPLMHGKRALGVLALGNPEQPLGAWQRDFLKRVARWSVWLLESALAFDEASKHLHRKAVLNDVLLAVVSSDDVEEAVHNATRHLRRVLHADAAMVLLPKADNTLEPIGVSPADLPHVRLPMSESLCGYVFETGQAVRVGDVREAPRYYPTLPDIQSEVCVPLRTRHGVIGVVNLESRRPDAFDEDDEQLLTLVAGHLALLLETVRLRVEMEARAQRMELVHRVVMEVVGLLDEESIVQTAAHHIAEHFGFEVTMVVLMDEKQQVRVRGVGGKKAALASSYCQETCPQNGVIAHVMHTGETALIHDTAASPLYRSLPGFEAGSELCVPLYSHDDDQRVIGVINVERGVKHAFSEGDKLALEAIAGVLSAVLSNARRYHRLNVTVQHLDAARATALDIIADLEMDTLLQRIVHRVKELLKARGAEIGLLDAENQVVRIVASENPWRDYTGHQLPLGEGIAGWVVATGETLAVEDYNALPRRSSIYPAAFRAVVCVPLKFRDEVLGVLTVYDSREGRVFDDDEVALLELLAPQVAIAIRNAMLYQELTARMEAQAKAEREMIRSARLAAVGELAAAVAHELNNPLTTVTGFVELALEDAPPDSSLAEDLALALEEAHRARNIVRRLLDFARRSEPVRIATDINDLLHETLALVKHLMATSGVTLKLDLAEELPLVYVDRSEMKQVFLNLITNALQTMPHGGVLRIRTFVEEGEEQAWVVVQVEDTGEGMTPEQQMRVFDPFFSLKQPGPSLGLSASYSIVQKHGGVLDVQSEKDKGSVFTVRLPID